MKNPTYLLVSLALIFACMVLSISLVSASTASTQLSEIPNSNRKIKFSEKIVPGHALYPLIVMKDKIRLTMLETTDQCIERVILASERLEQATTLIQQGDADVAVETLRKGQKYLAEATDQCQKENFPEEYREGIKKALQDYEIVLTQNKDAFSDHERAVIDQLIAENDALQKHLGE